MTSLSICTSSETVNSRSALGGDQRRGLLTAVAWRGLQDLQEIRRMFIRLREEAEGKDGDGVVAP